MEKSAGLRWLALYPEVGWERTPDLIWKRYAVMTNHRGRDMNWVTLRLTIELLTRWPEPATDANVPFTLVVRRGKAHLRMQLTPALASNFDRISLVFTTAAWSGLVAFRASSVDSAKILRK